ncbi:MAG: hypothetical protein NT179_07410 [Nitrospirae bacterium]|nr:hypothetical protein [Nitrospirota bacterium]
MRQRLKLALYLGFVDLLTCYLVVLPVSAFTGAESMTGYVRRATAANVTAMMTASRAATLSALGSAMTASTAGSVAVRVVTSSAGWPLLGIAVGMTLAMVYYDSTKVAAIKTAAAPPATYTIPGYTLPPGGTIQFCSNCYFGGGPGWSVRVPNHPPFDASPGCAGTANVGPVPAGWAGWYSYGNAAGCQALHATTTDSSSAVLAPAAPLTTTDIQNYLGGLAPSNANSMESNTLPVGSQGTPTPANATSSIPVPSAGLTTDVVPASQVAPTDVVVNPNATPPAGTTTTTSSTQPTTTTATKTTTTTTNPDGSTTATSTETATEAATTSCAAGNHEQRSFGGILQVHMDLWAGSGLLSALTLLKNLTWPSALPSFALSSTLFGNFTLDFSAWAGMLTALRSIIIAIAGFVAYRIVFVGSK